MSTISPPPWQFIEIDDCIVDDSKRRVASTPFIVADPARCKANGHLIAAAPDLEAALRELIESIDADLFEDDASALEPQLTGARAALRKAKGE